MPKSGKSKPAPGRGDNKPKDIKGPKMPQSKGGKC